ncbi:MAG TPA: carboxypeptidase-like regulatory domain-containing protein [Pyrinomonadaceae bacterium]|nr:carboxypeptidase-like regulatory domain-containing protein [Pyrinomonadaceae bacterium]
MPFVWLEATAQPDIPSECSEVLPEFQHLRLQKSLKIELDKIRVASPCPISWDDMTGDNRTRFCSHCQLNVYNFSELTRAEAEQLVSASNGRLCGRLYRRHDGTILTKDCPVGLRRLRQRVSRQAAAVFATLVALGSAVFGQTSNRDKKKSCVSQVKIVQTTKDSAEEYAVSGTVLDPNGAVIPYVTIVLKSKSGSRLRSVVTRDDGGFSFSGLSEGNYSLTMTANAFKKVVVPFKLGNNVNLTMAVTLLLSEDSMLIGVIVDNSMLDLPAGSFTMSGEVIRMLPH